MLAHLLHLDHTPLIRLVLIDLKENGLLTYLYNKTLSLHQPQSFILTI